MPNLNTGDLNRVMSMLDSRFFQIMDRVDGSYNGHEDVERPEITKRKRSKYIHAGLQREQMQESALDLMNKGVL